MTGQTRPPRGVGGDPGKPWVPERVPGITCPACGLTNEAGVPTCRNCGLPIASATDPLRGVTPGGVDLPIAHRSSVSALVGFVLVVGLLLVGGTLAVSGGGILSGGGRLVTPADDASPSPVAETAERPGGDQATTPGTAGTADGDGVEPTPEAAGTSFEYTCEDAAIQDLSSGKWLLSGVSAGLRSDDDGDYDQVYWKMNRTTKKDAKKAPTVRMEWTTPKEAQEAFGIPRVLGDRAIVITFNGTIDITANQTIEAPLLEGEGIEQIKKIQLFEDSQGKVRAVIGIRGDACARLEGKGWSAKANGKNGRVNLDIERIDS